MRDFKETFRSRNTLKNSGLRVGIRIAFTDTDKAVLGDTRRAGASALVPRPSFPWGTAHPAHPGQQRPQGFRCQLDTHGQCRSTVHRRHLPGRAGGAPLRGGLSGLPPARRRAAARSAEPGVRPPHHLAGVATTTAQAPPPVTGTCAGGGGSRSPPKLAHAHGHPGAPT